MKRALVFSGGGSKGAYQIGAWKAIKKLRIKIDIVTGTSIGAINGAFFVQGNYKKTKKLWLNLKTQDFFDIESPRKTAKQYIKNKGLDFSKSESLLKKLLSEEKIRKSKIDYGLVTVSLKNMNPKTLTKSEILEGKLLDFILASSTYFPVVETKKIGNEKYIDAGFYDNLPINLAIKMGADEIIAIDLSTIGFKKKIIDKEVKIDIIKSKYKEGLVLNFNPESAKKLMSYGYNDTMKFFKKLDGKKYTFRKDDIIKNYKRIGPTYESLLKKILLANANKAKLEIFKITKYNKIFKNIKEEKPLTDTMLDSLEYLGDIFDIKDDPVYNINKYNRKLIRKVKEINYIKINKKLKGKMLISYFYNKYNQQEEKEKLYKEMFNLALIFPKDFLAAIYLISLTQKYPITLMSDKFYNDIYKSINETKK